MSMNQIQSNWPLQKPQQLLYVELGSDNGAVGLGICEQGFSFRAIGPLQAEGAVNFAFALDGTTHLNGSGELFWFEDNGKSGGLKFTNVSKHFRETLRAWLQSEAKPKAVGREVTPAAALPLDSLRERKATVKSINATSEEETKRASPQSLVDANPAIPKPVIPVHERHRSTPDIVEPKP